MESPSTPTGGKTISFADENDTPGEVYCLNEDSQDAVLRSSKRSRGFPPKFLERFVLGKKFGSGSFGHVKEGIDKTTGERFAVKIVNVGHLTDYQRNSLLKEIDIMKTLDHPNVVQLYEVFGDMDPTDPSKRKLCMILELVEGGELFDWISEQHQFTERDACKIMCSILSAIDYLHKNNVVHRDIKPENLLCPKDHKHHVKIADFGLSTGNDRMQFTTMCGTPEYAAPEVLKGEDYGSKVDIWAAGVLLYILLSGYPPFWREDERSTAAMYEKIRDGDFPIHANLRTCSNEAVNLINAMLTVDPEERLSATECLDHQWIRNIHAASVHNMGDSLTSFKKYFSPEKRQFSGLNPQKVPTSPLSLNDSSDSIPLSFDE